MPTLDEIVALKLARVESVPDELITAVDKNNAALYRELLVLLDGLEVDENGRLTPNNIARIEAIAQTMRQSILGGEYRDAVLAFAREWNEMGVLNIQLMQQSFDITDKELYRQVLLYSQRNAVDLLMATGVDERFIVPFKDILARSSTSGATIGEASQTLKDFIEGTDELEGTLTRYVSQMSRDLFAIADAQYLNTIAEDVDVEWYRYSGGTVKDSREFCVERAGGYYRKAEVMSWGLIPEWQGRNRNTTPRTIFDYRGGYNCIHIIVPVDESIVPDSFK